MKLFKLFLALAALGVLGIAIQSCTDTDLFDAEKRTNDSKVAQLVAAIRATEKLPVVPTIPELAEVETRSPEISYTQFIGYKPELSILGEAIARIPELATTLSDRNVQITFFMPTNDAFESFLASTGFTSINEVPVETLAGILSNHVVAGRKAIPLLNETETSLTGKTLTIRSESNSKAIINGSIEIIKANGFVGAGMIHYIDGVITYNSFCIDNITSNLEANVSKLTITLPSGQSFTGIGALPFVATIGTYQGNMSSVITKQTQTATGLDVELVHFFDDGNGNTFWTNDKATLTPTNAEFTQFQVYTEMVVIGGTGYFSCASGLLINQGPLDFVTGKLGVNMTGKVCGGCE